MTIKWKYYIVLNYDKPKKKYDYFGDWNINYVGKWIPDRKIMMITCNRKQALGFDSFDQALEVTLIIKEKYGDKVKGILSHKEKFKLTKFK